MSDDKTYHLEPNDTVMNDDRTSTKLPKSWVAHDFAEEYRFELKAQIASGDYFILLATRLDALSQELEKREPNAHIVLERTISDLSFLHENYLIGKK
jgi:hypothetical protein